MDNTLIDDPQERAALAAEAPHWTVRPSPEIRGAVAALIRERGRNRAFWVQEGLRKVLGELGLRVERNHNNVAQVVATKEGSHEGNA
jgi:hypothetical protein